MKRVLARAAHDLGLAAWFGGAFMGAVGLNAATREIEDHTQRLRIANAGWFRWAPLTATAVGLHLVGAFGLRGLSGGFGSAGGTARLLAFTRAGVTLAALAATAETGRSGQQVVRAGDVPVATATQPISDTPEEVARAQQRLRVAQWLVPALTGALWVLNALQEERGHRSELLPAPGDL